MTNTNTIWTARKYRICVLPLQIYIISVFLLDLCLAREWLTSEVYEKTKEIRDRGLVWLKREQDGNFGWTVGDTPRAILAIASTADEDWPTENDLEARLSAKQLEIELLEKLIRHDVTPAGIAVYALAVNAVCKDPRNFYGHNLIVSLEKHHEDQDYPGYPEAFGFSITSLVSCLSGSHLHKRQVRHLALVANEGTSADSIQTRSMALLSLECFRRKRHNEALTKHMGEALKNLAHLQNPDGSFGNIFTTALAIQALSVVSDDTMSTSDEEDEEVEEGEGKFDGPGFGGIHWNRTGAVLALSKLQLSDGSFLGSIHATSEAVLAATALLQGIGILRMKRGKCSDFMQRSSHIQNSNIYFSTENAVTSESSVQLLDTIILTPSNSNAEADGRFRSNLDSNPKSNSASDSYSNGLSTMTMTVTMKSSNSNSQDKNDNNNNNNSNNNINATRSSTNVNYDLSQNQNQSQNDKRQSQGQGHSVAFGEPGNGPRFYKISSSSNNNNNNNNHDSNRGPSVSSFVSSTPNGEILDKWTKEKESESESEGENFSSSSSSSSSISSHTPPTSTTSTTSTTNDNDNTNIISTTTSSITTSSERKTTTEMASGAINTNKNSKGMAQIKYWLWIGSDPKTAEKVNITIQVPINSTFFQVMTKAADQNPQFIFSASSWPNGHYVHTLSGHQEQPIKYQYWLLYKLPMEPDPQTPPPTTYVTPVGVDNLQVHDGEIYLYWYKKL